MVCFIQVIGEKRSAEEMDEPPAKMAMLESPSHAVENGQKSCEEHVDNDAVTSSDSVESANTTSFDSS